MGHSAARDSLRPMGDRRTGRAASEVASRRGLVRVAVLSAALVGLVALGASLTRNYLVSEEVRVPAVVGASYAQAQARLREAGLTARDPGRHHDDGRHRDPVIACQAQPTQLRSVVAAIGQVGEGQRKGVARWGRVGHRDSVATARRRHVPWGTQQPVIASGRWTIDEPDGRQARLRHGAAWSAWRC